MVVWVSWFDFGNLFRGIMGKLGKETYWGTNTECTSGGPEIPVSCTFTFHVWWLTRPSRVQTVGGVPVVPDVGYCGVPRRKASGCEAWWSMAPWEPGEPGPAEQQSFWFEMGGCVFRKS